MFEVPVVVCKAVKYSLTHGVSQESAPLFAYYANMKIKLDSDYEGAKKWASVIRAVLKEFRAQNQALRSSEIRTLVWLVRAIIEKISMTSRKQLAKLMFIH